MGKLDEQIVAVGGRFDELATSMRAIEGALSSQKVALEGASAEARNTAQSFAEIATSVRAASAPLLSAGDKLAVASEHLAASIGAMRVWHGKGRISSAGRSARRDERGDPCILERLRQ